MNCLNNEKYLKAAIDSVYSQTFKDWEIIFFDDASEDKSVSIAKSYGDKVKCYGSTSRIPLGRARNLAVEKANGEFIAFLDCDDIWEKDKLQKQLDVFGEDKKLGLVYTNVTVFNDKSDLYTMFKKFKCPTGHILKDMLRPFNITMSSSMIRKEALSKLDKCFDERFLMAEDYDFFLRISYFYNVGYVKSPVTKWRFYPTSWSNRKHELFAEEREVILKEMIYKYPEISSKYAKEIGANKRSIAIDKGKSAWRNCDPKTARKFFVKYLLRDGKALFYYVFSFLPYEAFAAIRSFMFKYLIEEFR